MGPWGLRWSSGSVFKCFLGASGVPPGALLRTFSGFSRHDFCHVISDTFLERFFRVLCRFWIPSGIVFETFRRCSALAETVAPPARELCFRCFKRSETQLFPASLSKGLAETIFSTFRRILCSAGEPAAPLYAPWGAYFADGSRRDFWCQNDGFLGSAPDEGNRSISRGWPRARREIYFWL